MSMRRRSRKSRRHPEKSAGISLFPRKKPHRKRGAAVRLDLSDSTGSGAMVLSQRSNQIALAFCVLLVLSIVLYLYLEYDLDPDKIWPEPAAAAVIQNPDLPAQPLVADTVTPAEPIPVIRSRTSEAMEFRPKALPDALQKASLALDAARFDQHTEARRLMDEAYQADPTFSGWFYLSGRVACHAGDWKRMQEELEESIRREEAVLPSLALLGDTAFFLSNYNLAGGVFRRAHEMIPEEPWFLIRMSQAMRGLGDPAGARDLAVKAAQIPGADWAMAWVHLADLDAGKPAPGNLAAHLEGNTQGDRAGWWWLAAADAALRDDHEAARAAMVRFKEQASEMAYTAASGDPWCVKWLDDPVLGDRLPETPLHSWKKIRAAKAAAGAGRAASPGSP